MVGCADSVRNMAPPAIAKNNFDRIVDLIINDKLENSFNKYAGWILKSRGNYNIITFL
jgi:hypothetical protein